MLKIKNVQINEKTTPHLNSPMEIHIVYVRCTPSAVFESINPNLAKF